MRNGRAVICLALALLVVSGLAIAQDSKKEAQLRTVRGLVTDKDEKAIQNGVVFLKNSRTNSVISHFTDDQGNYRFSGLDPNAEYDIYAEFNGQKSAPRTVSPLDSRKEITLNLKVNRKKD
ncbi:MAG: carboxypeptidase-like regulatory domain-containing protein [Candidatus Acidiferrum sp.]